jgi:hypothetical protein
LPNQSGSARPLFTAGDDVYGWDDVVAFAKLRGDWDALVARLRTGLAALAELEARGQPIREEEIEAAARGFRYDRDLLAADELADWLERHRLTMADWQAYLCRTLAAERIAASNGDVPEHDLLAGAWAEGICSGRLEQLARELARRVAVSPGARLDQLEPAFEDFCATAVNDPAQAREVETHRLEWLRFAYEAIVSENEGAALEAVLCVRADGETLAAVAERAGLDLRAENCWLEELDPALGTRFLAATPGELVGPVSVADGYVVAKVISKIAPSLQDEAVAARAREAAVARAVSRLVADRVVWS